MGWDGKNGGEIHELINLFQGKCRIKGGLASLPKMGSPENEMQEPSASKGAVFPKAGGGSTVCLSSAAGLTCIIKPNVRHEPAAARVEFGYYLRVRAASFSNKLAMDILQRDPWFFSQSKEPE